ncbi:MAG: prepilin-type N-terminal cleavage/methylation domain-containing protein, partial [Victivallales bacterium]|nr:prepilin-type N-terminal cleavage/methylation domain-containing protein [Victivallales bacterium]
MRKRTFTLIELLAAIGIIAILAAITIGGLSFATAKADYSKTQSIIEKFGVA